jgi:hypothetical protein
MSGRGPEVCSAHARVSPALFSYFTSVVVQVPWLPKGWKGVRMRNQKLRKICPSGALPGSEGFPRFFLSTEGWCDIYDVHVIYLAWLLELALVIYPFPSILFSYNIYIYVV